MYRQLQLYLNLNACGKIQAHEGLNGLLVGVENIDQSLVGSALELLTAILVLVDSAKDGLPLTVEAKGKAPVMTDEGAALVIKAGKCTVSVDKATGYLAGYHDGTRQMIKAPFVPNFWRAELDNDWRGWKPAHYLRDWKTAADYLATDSADTEVEASIDGLVAVVKVSKDIHDGKAALELTYSVYPVEDEMAGWHHQLDGHEFG